MVWLSAMETLAKDKKEKLMDDVISPSHRPITGP